MASRLISIALAQYSHPQKEPAPTNWESEYSRVQEECAQLKALLADTEQAAALALERQIASAVERARAEFIAESSHQAPAAESAEIARLSAENESLKIMLSEAEQASAIALERQVGSAAERARADLSREQDRLRKEFAVERERLQQELQKAGETVARTQAEAAMFAQWESERSESLKERAHLKAELERIQADHSQLEKRLMAAESESGRARQAKNSKPAAADNKAETIVKEAARVEARIRDMQDLAADPDADLSDVVRTNVERAQLESYLDGLRFAISGSSQLLNGVHRAGMD
jgi:chromosome segregation ATPase